MDIIIKSPTKAYIKDIDEELLKTLQKKLSYQDTSVAFLIQKHLKNQWFKNSNPILWQDRLNELQGKLKFSLLFKDSSGYWIRPGIIPYLKESLTVINNIKYPALNSIRWAKEPNLIPYIYQKESVEKLLKARHGCVRLATGLGKSLILLMLAREIGNCVVVTPSLSIFKELVDLFQKSFGEDMVGMYGDGKKDITKPITIAIGKSLTLIKENTDAGVFFRKKHGVLVDESHCWSADTLEEVCHGILKDVPYRFFASATQVNNSGKTILLNSVIGRCVYEMDIGDGINQGYLCPLGFSIINVFSPDTRDIKDPTKCKRAHFLYNDNIAQVAAKIANGSWEIKKQSTLILVEELKQIEMIQKLLTVPFAYVHSADKRKSAEFGLEKVKLQEQVDRFNSGQVKVLIGTRAIATGTNIFPTHNVINWVGGSSEIVTKQGTMGRSTRKLEISKYKDMHNPKKYSMIYDFRITGIPMLDKQLRKRVAFYKESGGEVRYF